jgi:excisionase family DNA binding protein
MTVAEAAGVLGVSRQRVQALIASGKLSAVRRGARSYDIDPAALDAVRDRPTGRPVGKKDSQPRRKKLKSIA